MNDDSDLYTGISYGGSFSNIPENKEEKRKAEEALEQSRRIKPGLEYVKTLIAAEIEHYSDFRSYLSTTKSTGDEILAEFKGREKYFGFLGKLDLHIDGVIKDLKEDDDEGV